MIHKSTTCLLFMISGLPILPAQPTQIGEVMILNHPAYKANISPEAFLSFAGKEWVPSWNKTNPQTPVGIYRADRGEGKNQLLLAYMLPGSVKRDSKKRSGPFGPGLDNKSKSTLSVYLNNPDEFTEYRLIGADPFKSLPAAGILGLHYIQVRPERAAAFEKLVKDKLHPALGSLLPDMQMLYYKQVAGNASGFKGTTYLTVFTIASPAARDKYWPTGQPETEMLKQAFQPWNELAKELSSYLVEDSYLLPGNGAAAIFESKRWTDYVHYFFLN